MDVTFIQNTRSGGPGLVGEYVRDRGWTPRVLTRHDILDQPVDAIPGDIVVILGSPKGVYETNLPWIARERALALSLIGRSIPVFGICFGAQLVATAIGGDVRPTGKAYQGWIENDLALDPVWQGPWLRWHGDRIFLPDGVETFAQAGGIPQAFRHGTGVGVQFHPEASDTVVSEWIVEKSEEQAPAIDQLIKARDFAKAHGAAIRKRSFALFDHVFALLTSPASAT